MNKILTQTFTHGGIEFIQTTYPNRTFAISVIHIQQPIREVIAHEDAAFTPHLYQNPTQWHTLCYEEFMYRLQMQKPGLLRLIKRKLTFKLCHL